MLRNREITGLILIYAAVCITAVFLCFLQSFLSGFICGGALILVGTAFYLFTRVRYKKIAEMSDYIRKMSDAGFVYDIRDNAEGELSILKNDIYKLAARLSEQASLLNEDKATLKDVLFDISHQLKTPVTSLTVMADLLEMDDLPLDKRQEFISNIQIGLSRMDWLIKSLLKMAKLDAGTEELKHETVLIVEIAKQALNAVTVLIDIKNLKLKIKIDESLNILCDRNWTVEALVNILKNAAEHSPENGEIAIDAGENPLCIWVTVADCGSGIDPSDIPHLFKRFYKGKSTCKDSVGIGLALSLAIMCKQNGDIEVKSEKTGSEFTLKFYK